MTIWMRFTYQNLPYVLQTQVERTDRIAEVIAYEILLDRFNLGDEELYVREAKYLNI